MAEITRLCGCLPLAVGMLARQLHHHPAWTVAELAAELAAARDRLELMQAENPSVAAAFDLSYQELTPGQQRLFRRLGLHLGPDIDAYAAALDGADLATVRHHLDALYDHYLIAEPARGRYRFHDLIREHARALAAVDQPADRDAATGRLLDYYLHTAAITEDRLARQSRTRPGPAAVTSPPAAVPDLPDSARALAWARAERANLLSCLDHATRAGQHARVVALTAATAALLRQDGPWTDPITRHITAIQAARQAGDRLGQANALGNLGIVRFMTSDYPGAARALEEALGILRDLGERSGEAEVLNEAGTLHLVRGSPDRAGACHQQALALARELASPTGEAHALAGLGRCALAAGRTTDALAGLRQAREIFQRIGAAEAAGLTAELDALAKAEPPAEEN